MSKSRINLNLEKGIKAKIERIRESQGYQTDTQAINAAIRLLDIIVFTQQHGQYLYEKNEKGEYVKVWVVL